MEQKRLFLAIAISIVILLVFQVLAPPPRHQAVPAPQTVASTRATPPGDAPPASGDLAFPGTQPAAVAPPANAPRLPIHGARVAGSIDLVGARFDDLVLDDYHETVSPKSPLVRILEPQRDPQPNLIQLGWAAAPGETVKLPDSTTLWKTTATAISPGSPATLTWDNGAGLTFAIRIGVDANYMFTVDQSVRNAGTAPVRLYPWSRVSRGYTPVVAGSYLIHEGPIGVLDGTLHELGYKATETDSQKNGGVALSVPTTAGWAGITDKYWLSAVIPSQTMPLTASYRYVPGAGDDAAGTYQVDTLARDPVVAPPGGQASVQSHVFAGAKEVHLLDAYMRALDIPHFDKAVDFGYFYFLTKPIFFMLDWLSNQLGNFGLAILVFTLFVKALFFPLATKSYRSMSKMRLLAPRMQQVRERHKGDQAAIQRETMALYKTEGVNPASGCLPMLIQIPVFFCLYKVLYVTIEMRHAPFFGWIHDLSAPDPTTVFNLFGLLPYDPGKITPYLELGVWPLILMATMFLQQRLNPPPPDPAQQRIFQFMPILFTFMMARFPAGLVIYYCWNNLLTVTQQWFIMRNTTLTKRQPKAVRT
jgi:YidC/Oxa1 family membrane protein insertase